MEFRNKLYQFRAYDPDVLKIRFVSRDYLYPLLALPNTPAVSVLSSSIFLDAPPILKGVVLDRSLLFYDYENHVGFTTDRGLTEEEKVISINRFFSAFYSRLITIYVDSPHIPISYHRTVVDQPLRNNPDRRFTKVLNDKLFKSILKTVGYHTNFYYRMIFEKYYHDILYEAFVECFRKYDWKIYSDREDHNYRNPIRAKVVENVIIKNISDSVSAIFSYYTYNTGPKYIRSEISEASITRVETEPTSMYRRDLIYTYNRYLIDYYSSSYDDVISQEWDRIEAKRLFMTANIKSLNHKDIIYLDKRKDFKYMQHKGKKRFTPKDSNGFWLI